MHGRGWPEPHLANGWLVEFPGVRVRTEQGYYLTISPQNPAADSVRNWLGLQVD